MDYRRCSSLAWLLAPGLVVMTTSTAASAQEAPPTVAADAGGAAKDADTEAAEKEKAGAREPGWSPGIAVGASFNLIDTRSVVGQPDGTAFTFGGGLDASLEFNEGIHEWRNTLGASAGTARTAALDEFIKTNDGLGFESIYLVHVVEMFGPFARFGLNTQMFSATDVRPTTESYTVANLDGTTDEYTGRRLGLTDPFQPFTLKESLGVFVQPIREDRVEIEARVGFGAQETFAEGGLAIADDDATDIIEAKELDDNFAVGAEGVFNMWGFLDDAKRISYTLGVGVLVPFVTSELPEGDDRGLGELTGVEAIAGLNVKILDFASLGYKLNVMRQPLLVEETQVSNSLLLTIGGAFGSKAPKPVEPPPCDCPEEPPAEEPPAEEPPPAEPPSAEPPAEPAEPEPPPPELSPEPPPPPPEPAPEPEPEPAPEPPPAPPAPPAPPVPAPEDTP